MSLTGKGLGFSIIPMTNLKTGASSASIQSNTSDNITVKTKKGKKASSSPGG